jgi:hypothetical protein
LVSATRIAGGARRALPGLTRLSCKIGYLLTSNSADQSTASEFLTGEATNITNVGPESCATLAVVFRDQDSPLEEIRKASRGKHLMCARPRHCPRIVPEPERCPRLRAFPWSRVRKAVRSRQETRRLPPARREQRSCRSLCSLDYRHQHIDMVTRGAASSSRSNDP